MPEMPLWYAGVCDTMARKVLAWYRNWHLAPAYATNKMLNTNDGSTIEIVTQRYVPLVWTRPELEHLVRILKALRPNLFLLSADGTRNIALVLESVLQNFDTFKLLPAKQRLIPIGCCQEDPKQILDALVEAKTGKSSFEQEAAAALKRGESILG